MKNRIRLLLLTIRALLWSKPGTGALNGRPESSLEERLWFARIAAQLLARVLFLLLCLLLGVGLDDPRILQGILMI